MRKKVEMGHLPDNKLKEFQKILKIDGVVEIEGVGTFALKRMPKRIRFNVGRGTQEKSRAHTKLSFKIAPQLKKKIQPWRKKK